MPELPDVEILKQYFDATALHQTIKEVTVLNAKVLKSVSKARLARALTGRRFQSTRRHGKYLLAEANSAAWLVLHFGMTGSLKYSKDNGQAGEYARMKITFAGGGCLAYISQRMLGKVALAESFERFVEEKQLGPDALTFDRVPFRQLFERSHGAVKVLLMNQKRIAGIGNIYSDEILFQSAIHPQTSADSLDKKQRDRIYNKTRTVLQTAIRQKADPQKLPRSYLLPSREKGSKCPRCGTEIATVRIGQRTSFFCPKCQGETV